MKNPIMMTVAVINAVIAVEIPMYTPLPCPFPLPTFGGIWQRDQQNDAIAYHCLFLDFVWIIYYRLCSKGLLLFMLAWHMGLKDTKQFDLFIRYGGRPCRVFQKDIRRFLIFCSYVLDKIWWADVWKMSKFLHAIEILGRTFSICNVCALLFVLLLFFNRIWGGGTRLLALFAAFQLVVTMWAISEETSICNSNSLSAKWLQCARNESASGTVRGSSCFC